MITTCDNCNTVLQNGIAWMRTGDPRYYCRLCATRIKGSWGRSVILFDLEPALPFETVTNGALAAAASRVIREMGDGMDPLEKGRRAINTAYRQQYRPVNRKSEAAQKAWATRQAKLAKLTPEERTAYWKDHGKKTMAGNLRRAEAIIEKEGGE